MKLKFEIIVRGKEILNEKLQKIMLKNPNWHLEIAREFLNSLMIKFDIKNLDNMSIESMKIDQLQPEK